MPAWPAFRNDGSCRESVCGWPRATSRIWKTWTTCSCRPRWRRMSSIRSGMRGRNDRAAANAASCPFGWPRPGSATARARGDVSCRHSATDSRGGTVPAWEGLLPGPERRSFVYRPCDECPSNGRSPSGGPRNSASPSPRWRDSPELSFAAPGLQTRPPGVEAQVADFGNKIRSLQRMKRSPGRIVDRRRAEGWAHGCAPAHKGRERSRG